MYFPSIQAEISDSRHTFTVAESAVGLGKRSCATHRLIHDLDRVVSAATSWMRSNCSTGREFVGWVSMWRISLIGELRSHPIYGYLWTQYVWLLNAFFIELSCCKCRPDTDACNSRTSFPTAYVLALPVHVQRA